MIPSDRPLRTPHPDRLPTDADEREAILAAHDAALAADEPGYDDPVTGLFVFTAQSLLNQGECCDSRCRHCPYV